jgi:hypothetical protein
VKRIEVVAIVMGAIAGGCGGSAPASIAGTETSGEATHATTGESTGAPADATESSASDGSGDTSGAGCPSGDGTFEVRASPPAGSLVTDPLAPLPDTLAEVGIYPEAPDLSVVADGAIHYEPAWPLWSSGSDKHRFVVLPVGASVDTSDPDRWVFPVGTLLFKTFLYADGVDGCARPVETRVIRKAEDGTWDYAVYGWDEAGMAASQLDLGEPVPIPVVGADGPFDHHVPARIECRACHESGVAEVLGFARLQLSVPRVDGEDDQLEVLAASGVLSESNELDIIDDPDDGTRRVLGMFAGNCVHCHNGSGGPSSSFDLRHDVALANTVNHETESSASASGIRIVPGSPETSILFLAFSGETDDPEVSAMPPMGVDVRDQAAIELLRAFILELP